MFSRLKKIIFVFFCCLAAALIVAYFQKLSLLVIPLALLAIFLVLKIINEPVFGVVVVAFLLPFERIGAFELGSFTVRGSQIFALVTILSWLAEFLTKKKNLQAKNPLIIPLCFFLGVSALSLIGAVNLSRGVSVLAFEIFVMLFSLVIPDLLRDKKNLQKVIVALVLACFLTSLFGFYQFLGDMAGLPKEITGLREHYTKSVFGFPRIQSTAAEPLYFANFLLIPISILLALFVRRAEDKSRERENFLLRPPGIVFILSLAVINLILTVSRGAYIALAVVLFLTFLVFFKYFLSPKRLIPLILVGLVAVFAVVKMVGLDRRQGLETFIEHSTDFSTGVAVKERLTTYDQAINLINRSPYFGVGVGNFGPAVAQNPNLMPQDGWLIVNNLYLEIWAERGIFGLFFFGVLVLFLVTRSLKALLFGEDKYLKTLLMGLLIAFIAILVQYNTFSILFFFHFWFLIGLTVAVQNLLLTKFSSSQI